MTPGSPNHLGPLPEFDRNSTLQALSIRALTQLLPPDHFRLRDERMDDAGVDLSLELLIDSRSTNLRAQIQLKSTDAKRVNADGSVSRSAEVSNLNYLLNGPSPLYVLYIAPRDELRFVWVQDECRRLIEMNPGWMGQETVTLRFHQVLTAEALPAIHERVMREARWHRQVRSI